MIEDWPTAVNWVADKKVADDRDPELILEGLVTIVARSLWLPGTFEVGSGKAEERELIGTAGLPLVLSAPEASSTAEVPCTAVTGHMVV
jgi:hypothetical protein